MQKALAINLDSNIYGTIAEIGAGQEVARPHRLVRPQLATDTHDIFESYVRLLDRADPNWQSHWIQKKLRKLQINTGHMAKP